MFSFFDRVEASEKLLGSYQMDIIRTVVPRGSSWKLAIYLGVRFLAETATMAQSVAIGWTIYKLTNAPLALGIVGIVQFIPMLLLALPAGELCDQVSPQPLLCAGLMGQCLGSLAFLLL